MSDINSETAKQPGLTTDDASPGWDMMLEDMFGLNLRGARTMWDLIVRPAAVFQAARRSDWLLKYTPTVRLVLSIIALMIILRFIWTSDDSLMQRYMVSMVEADTTIEEKNEVLLFTDILFDYWFIVLPFAYAIIHILTALCYRIWGETVTATEHVRLYFAGLAPGALFGLLALTFTAYVPYEALTASMVLMFLGYFLIYAVTMYRGLGQTFTKAGKRWRAGLFGVVAVAMDQVASLLAIAVATLIFLAALFMGFHDDELNAFFEESDAQATKSVEAS